MTQKQRFANLAFCCVVCATLLLVLIALFRAERDSPARGSADVSPMQSNPNRRILVDDGAAGHGDAANDVVQQLRKAGRVNLDGKNR